VSWSIAASSTGDLGVAAIAAGATLIGATVTGVAQYLAGPRLDRAKRQAEGHIAAKLLYDDVYRASKPILDAKSAAEDMTMYLDLQEHRKDVLGRSRAFDSKIASDLRKLSAIAITAPAWDKYRTALASVTNGDEWILVAGQVDRLETAESLRSTLVDNEVNTENSDFTEELKKFKEELKWASLSQPIVLDLLQPFTGTSKRGHEGFMVSARVQRDLANIRNEGERNRRGGAADDGRDDSQREQSSPRSG
jgi:hypothetical protein